MHYAIRHAPDGSCEDVGADASHSECALLSGSDTGTTFEEMTEELTDNMEAIEEVWQHNRIVGRSARAVTIYDTLSLASTASGSDVEAFDLWWSSTPSTRTFSSASSAVGADGKSSGLLRLPLLYRSIHLSASSTVRRRTTSIQTANHRIQPYVIFKGPFAPLEKQL